MPTTRRRSRWSPARRCCWWSRGVRSGASRRKWRDVREENMYHFDWISATPSARPDKLALVDAHTGRQFTYAQFNERANRLASFLTDTLGIRAGRPGVDPGPEQLRLLRGAVRLRQDGRHPEHPQLAAGRAGAGVSSSTTARPACWSTSRSLPRRWTRCGPGSAANSTWSWASERAGPRANGPTKARWRG